MNVYEKLLAVQTELKSPKSQHNDFGNFNYRSCEDILEAVKPLLQKVNAVVTISDEITNIGSRFYVKATASFRDPESTDCITTAAYAREPETRPKMDDAQATGSSSSYARKYALNGLFCIDDAKDPDATNTGQKADRQKPAGSSAHIGQQHIDAIRREIRRTGAQEKAVCYQYRIKSLQDMTMKQFRNAMDIFKGMPDMVPEGQQYEMDFGQYENEMPFG